MKSTLKVTEFFSPNFHLEIGSLVLVTKDIFCFLPTSGRKLGDTIMLTTSHVMAIDDGGIPRDWDYIKNFSSILYGTEEFEILTAEDPRSEIELNKLIHAQLESQVEEENILN